MIHNQIYVADDPIYSASHARKRKGK